MVTGSVAAIFYGEPRLTHDVDFVTFLTESDIGRLVQAFPAADYYLPPPEVIATEVHREQRGHFNIIHVESGFKADLYMTGRDELNAWGFGRRRQIQFEGVGFTLAPPEYVIIRKLEYYREGGSDKHLRDIRSILAVSGAQIDRTALQEWISKLGLNVEWRLISEESPPGR